MCGFWYNASTCCCGLLGNLTVSSSKTNESINGSMPTVFKRAQNTTEGFSVYPNIGFEFDR